MNTPNAPSAPSAFGTQIGGDHYIRMIIQPLEFSMQNGMDACQHTIIKYVSRFRNKNGLQDLEKAKHVLEMLIEFEKKAQLPPPKPVISRGRKTRK